MTREIAKPDAPALKDAARPLLELMHRLTGLETTFLTRIDWTGQQQDVLIALNTSSELEVAEGTRVDWADSMCRHMFLSGESQSTDVGSDFPGSLGADVVGMQSFFAVPVTAGDEVIGTVCGASRRRVHLSDETLEHVRLIGEALAQQLRVERDLALEHERSAELEQQALTDVLTGLPNRRAFISRWEEELARSGRHGHPLAILMLDVDRFKEINDELGHAQGDRVLFQLGEVLRNVSRAEDVAARLGGDEFALVCTESDMAGALELAERIRDDFARITADGPAVVTLSIGISCSATTRRGAMLEAADRALYRSKAQGRDRVEMWNGDLTDVVDLSTPSVTA